MINFIDLGIINFIFLMLFISGASLINYYEKNLKISFYFFSPFVGIISLITFSSLISFIQIFINFKLYLVYFLYFFLVIFSFKKNLLKKKLFLIIISNLIILNSLPFVTITYDSIYYKSIGFNLEFLTENKILFSNLYSTSMSSFFYLINFISYFSKNFIVNFYPIIAFNIFCFIFYQFSEKYEFNLKFKIYLFLFIVIFFFSRNLYQHIFYYNSHLLTSICIFLIVCFNSNLNNNSKIFLIISLLFLRIDNFIYILILYLLNFIKIFNFNLSKKDFLLINSFVLLKLLVTALFLQNEISILTNKIIIVISALFIIHSLQITYNIKEHFIIKQKTLKIIIWLAIIINFVFSIVETQNKINIYFYNIFLDNYAWGLTWYLFFGYFLYYLFKNIKINPSFFFVFTVLIIYFFIINYGHFNIRTGFGDASNRLMFHIYFVIIFEFIKNAAEKIQTNLNK